MTAAALRRVAAFVLPLALVAGCTKRDPEARFPAQSSATAAPPAALEAPAHGYVGSGSCLSCHEDEHESWTRTFHRTMTQLPTAAAVQGAFDGRAFLYAEKAATPRREKDRFFVDLPADGATPARTAEVALVVGSRRYQQYFERKSDARGDDYRRIPILWHTGERRWMHLNTVFLGPDDPNWSTHATQWNSNCIFCHNTGPRPGLVGDPDTVRAAAARFDSKVAEFGIACEACHGPGEQHIAARRRAEALGLTKLADDPIVHPKKLDASRSAAVCGQCHGQRLPEPPARLVEWLVSGPSFRPGDLLAAHARPVRAATPSPDRQDPELFAKRFWRDGTPRLSAYEYQGLVDSKCATSGPATCTSCHAAHKGDPRGMIEAEKLTNAACVACHRAIGEDVAAHTRHAPDSSGSSCYDCHMPRIVYGVLETHRSHRIEVPDAERDAAMGRPNACTLCHLDRSIAWAGAATRRLFGERFQVPKARADRAPVDMADGAASLLAGDVVTRAVYAAAFRRSVRAVDGSTNRAAAIVALAATLGDGYPSVRRFAAQGLSIQEKVGVDPEMRALLGRFDFGDAAARADCVRSAFLALERLMPATGDAAAIFFTTAGKIDVAALAALLALQPDEAVSIGE